MGSPASPPAVAQSCVTHWCCCCVRVRMPAADASHTSSSWRLHCGRCAQTLLLTQRCVTLSVSQHGEALLVALLVPSPHLSPSFLSPTHLLVHMS